MTRHCYQINLQEHFGGGEVYTEFLTRALSDCGCSVTLLVSPRARFWGQLDLPGATLIAVTSVEDVLAALPETSSWILSHTHLPDAWSAVLAQRHVLTGMAHMPMLGRDPRQFRHHHLIFPVSEYVRSTLREAGLSRTYPDPLYGVARVGGADPGMERSLVAASVYEWDLRKGRDRLLSHLHPLWWKLQPAKPYQRRPGVTLGVVSRLTPIKQFPLLFKYIAPVLATRPDVNLEIFGSGGYASVRDTRRALRPLGNRVRFWGHQRDVASVYRQIDYLLTGLPEKEALGLNVVEAQACGTPILAVGAPPFTETVADGVTGYLYRDPRLDQGADFARVLDRICRDFPERLTPLDADEHLRKFSFAAFRARVEILLHTIDQLMSP